MNRPCDHLRQLAARLCSERSRRRLIDPAIADLQAEVAAARRAGSTRQRVRAHAAGYLSIAKVLAIAVFGDLRHESSTWQPEERAGARRGAIVAIGATIIATGLFVVPLVDNFNVAVPALLALYVTPAALPVSVPLGLMLGVAWAFHGAARTRKLAIGALVLSGLCSIAMFVNLGWLTPETNQAFRVLAFDSVRAEFPDSGESAQPLQRGFNELSLPAMRARLIEMRATESPSEVRALEVALYRKLALSVAAPPLVGLLLALAFRRRWGRGRLMAAAIATFAAYIVVDGAAQLFGARLGLPTLVIGWSATALCAVATVLITSSRSRARA
jgi:hypothetical protein